MMTHIAGPIYLSRGKHKFIKFLKHTQVLMEINITHMYMRTMLCISIYSYQLNNKKHL